MFSHMLAEENIRILCLALTMLKVHYRYSSFFAMEHRNNTISVLLKIVLGVEALIAPIIAKNSSTKNRGGGGGQAEAEEELQGRRGQFTFDDCASDKSVQGQALTWGTWCWISDEGQPCCSCPLGALWWPPFLSGLVLFVNPTPSKCTPTTPYFFISFVT